MDLKNLFKQLTGSSDNEHRNANANANANANQGIGDSLSKLASNIPGGLAGGAAAGGIMALLMGNKSARKVAGKVAGYGGAAMLGGLAYKAYRNWKQNDAGATSTSNADTVTVDAAPHQNVIPPPDSQQPVAELTLIKAMIGAAKSDGHIDAEEQQRIFEAVDQMGLSADMKGKVFDYLRQPISVQELAAEAYTMEQKSEIYLASCMVIRIDHPSERGHLDQLAATFKLPEGLSNQLELQAQQAIG
jgi:uncharacterized membrane protein YebE (DUF533 family)